LVELEASIEKKNNTVKFYTPSAPIMGFNISKKEVGTTKSSNSLEVNPTSGVLNIDGAERPLSTIISEGDDDDQSVIDMLEELEESVDSPGLSERV
jgi:hypothetical protein